MEKLRLPQYCYYIMYMTYVEVIHDVGDYQTPIIFLLSCGIFLCQSFNGT
jgi:acetone carboxylase gamma subunit